MKEMKQLFVSKTQYNNLQEECLIMLREFIGKYKWTLTEDKEQSDVIINIVEGRFFIEIFYDKSGEYLLQDVDQKFEIKARFYKCLASYTTKKLPWGMLQGIRPTKLVYKIYHRLAKKIVDTNKSNTNKSNIIDKKEEIINELENRYMVSREMAVLAIKVASFEQQYLPQTVIEASKKFSVYISIPFCPTRCHYCSFPANSISNWEDKMDEYVNGLISEMEAVLPKLFMDNQLSTIYIGGGTPTSLNVEQLDKLLGYITSTFPMNQVKEFTVEAGRPDTITIKKLKVLRKYGVLRISINPQSMNQTTLNIIGRKHSIDDIYKAYEMAKEIGFTRINMDLILGLPGESIEDVKYTFDRIKEIRPNEVTVHTLAIKRSSKIHEEIEKYHLPNDNEIKEMLNISRKVLTSELDYKPYYLYRQKNMMGSYENVGYCLNDNPCIYNMETMEEVLSIIAFGAGGITKLVDNKGKVTRIENVKNAQSYLERLDEMIERKNHKLG